MVLSCLVLFKVSYPSHLLLNILSMKAEDEWFADCIIAPLAESSAHSWDIAVNIASEESGVPRVIMIRKSYKEFPRRKKEGRVRMEIKCWS